MKSLSAISATRSDPLSARRKDKQSFQTIPGRVQEMLTDMVDQFVEPRELGDDINIATEITAEA